MRSNKVILMNISLVLVLALDFPVVRSSFKKAAVQILKKFPN